MLNHAAPLWPGTPSEATPNAAPQPLAISTASKSGSLLPSRRSAAGNLLLAAACLTTLALNSPPTSAAIITESLTGVVTSGPFAGTVGLGSFSYEDTSITGLGDESVSPFDGLTFEFTIFGQTFHETDDPDYDFFPALNFTDGVPVFLDFLVTEPTPDILAPGVIGFGIFSQLTPLNAGGWQAEVFVVPEPNGAAFAAVSGLGLGLVAVGRRRIRKAAQA